MHVPAWIARLHNRQAPAAQASAPSQPGAVQQWLHDILVSNRPQPKGDVASISAQIIAFLGNEEPPSGRPPAFISTPYTLSMDAMGTSTASSVVAVDMQDGKNYYEGLKSFTRSYVPLCEAMGGNVNENDVIPIVHYAIAQVAQKVAARKHAPLDFSPLGLKPLHTEIATQIKANVQLALEAGGDFKPRMQQFMLAETTLQPEVALTKIEKDQRVELITRYLQSEQREEQSGLNFCDAITKRKLQASQYPEHNMYDRIQERVAAAIHAMDDKGLAGAYLSQIDTIVKAGVEQYVVHNASDAQWDSILKMHPQQLSDDVAATIQKRMAQHQAAPTESMQRSR